MTDTTVRRGAARDLQPPIALTLIREKEVGNRIVRALLRAPSYRQRILLIFTDATAVLLQLDREEHQLYGSPAAAKQGIDWWEWKSELIAAGIVTAAEWQAAESTRQAMWDREHEAFERQELARLRAKYGA